jgi:formamidopyrimidine-DNA glycosylase
VLLLDKGLALRFDDARKFGRVWFVDDPKRVIGDLGPDALAMDESTFIDDLRARHRALKPLLLDQSFVAGIGNIYADESLFRARLHPNRIASSISRKQASLLYAAIGDVLREGIAANGASFDWVYPDGAFQENFRVYGQTDRPCVNCGTPIVRLIVGQRSTHICPTCQKP